MLSESAMLRVLFVTPSFFPAFYFGGPPIAAHSLCNALVGAGVDVRVITTDAADDKGGRLGVSGRTVDYPAGYSVTYCRRFGNGTVSASLLTALCESVRDANVVHLSGVYSFPTFPALGLARALSKPIVWSAHGAFQDAHQSRRGILKATWRLGCRALKPKKTVIHFTSALEERESRMTTRHLEKVVIPHGVDIPDTVAARQPSNAEPLELLYVGRLHPVKAVDTLLHACEELNRVGFTNWFLNIAGEGDSDYVATIQRQILRSNLGSQVRLLGRVTGREKDLLFQSADMLILPSPRENFGMVVAEALANGTPVIVTHGAPWHEVESIGCGLAVRSCPETISDAVIRMSRMPRHEMGQRGRDWMRAAFSWKYSAAQLKQLYSELTLQ
jgi:glycosyltransferase involved in cell wall biosynthesis